MFTLNDTSLTVNGNFIYLVGLNIILIKTAKAVLSYSLFCSCVLCSPNIRHFAANNIVDLQFCSCRAWHD